MSQSKTIFCCFVEFSGCMFCLCVILLESVGYNVYCYNSIIVHIIAFSLIRQLLLEINVLILLFRFSYCYIVIIRWVPVQICARAISANAYNFALVWGAHRTYWWLSNVSASIPKIYFDLFYSRRCPACLRNDTVKHTFVGAEHTFKSISLHSILRFKRLT